MLRGAALGLTLGLATGCLGVPEPGGGGTGDSGVSGGGAWLEVQASDPDVPAMWGARAVYDGTRGQLVMYGGSRDQLGLEPHDGFYAWDGSQWDVLCEPCAPGPRIGHGLAYDSANERLLLFGGYDDGLDAQNDLWVYAGGTWSQIAATGDPPTPRSGVWFAEDPARGVVVLYGGDVDDVPLADLYELRGDEWIHRDDIPLDSGPGPRMNYAASGAYLAGRGLLVFADSEVARDDLWAFDGDAWRNLCDGCTGRAMMASAIGVDPVRSRIVVAGGFDGVELDVTVELDGDGALVRSRGGLPIRDSSAIAYDAGHGQLVLFGGNGDSCGENCGDTYVYAP